MSYLSHKQGKGIAYVISSSQVAEMAKCSRPPQTDVIFVARDALIERIYVEDLIAKRNVTTRSYPCVLDLTVVFLSLFASKLILGFQIRNWLSTIIFEGQLTNSHKYKRKVPGLICESDPEIFVLKLQDSSRLTNFIILRYNCRIFNILWIALPSCLSVYYFNTLEIRVVPSLFLLLTLRTLTRVAP